MYEIDSNFDYYKHPEYIIVISRSYSLEFSLYIFEMEVIDEL